MLRKEALPRGCEARIRPPRSSPEAVAKAMVCRGEMMVAQRVLRTRRGVLQKAFGLSWWCSTVDGAPAMRDVLGLGPAAASQG